MSYWQTRAATSGRKTNGQNHGSNLDEIFIYLCKSRMFQFLSFNLYSWTSLLYSISIIILGSMMCMLSISLNFSVRCNMNRSFVLDTAEQPRHITIFMSHISFPLEVYSMPTIYTFIQCEVVYMRNVKHAQAIQELRLPWHVYLNQHIVCACIRYEFEQL